MTKKKAQETKHEADAETVVEKDVILFWVGPSDLAQSIATPKSTQPYPSDEPYLITLEANLKEDGYNTKRMKESEAREIISQHHKKQN